MRRGVKTFEFGERIEFQASPGEPWKPATYVRADTEPLGKGWHVVNDTGGFLAKHYVPTRRIRKVGVS